MDMERFMPLQQYVRQLRPRTESYTPHVDKIQNILSEDIKFPTDVLDGFEFTQTDKSEKSRVQIKVVSDDRDTDRDEILRRLKNAGISANITSASSSVDPIDGNHDGRNFRINVKPKSGGMGESTLNSSITELFPCIAFEKKLNPTNVEDFMVKLMAVDLSTCKCIIKSDLPAAEATVNGADASSKFKEKMENALGILKFINDQHNDKSIKDVYWGYRGKPSGVPGNHPGDMFIQYADNVWLGVSLKAGGKKTKEPQLNTYHNTIFVNSKGPDFNDNSGKDALRKAVYTQVYSKIKGMPSIQDYDNRKGKSKTDAAINKLSKKDQDSYYDQYLGLVRQALVDRFNKDKKSSLKYIKDAILREAPDVPTIVIKAVGSSYEEVTDRDAVGVFLPQVEFVKAYLSSGRKSKQNWFIALLSGEDVITLSMAVRSSTGGKLKQNNLKVTYNGLK
jgi:hypothetical protein